MQRPQLHAHLESYGRMKTYANFILLRDTFSNANDQRDFGFNRLDNSVGSEWWGNIDDGSFRFRLVVSLRSTPRPYQFPISRDRFAKGG